MWCSVNIFIANTIISTCLLNKLLNNTQDILFYDAAKMYLFMIFMVLKTDLSMTKCLIRHQKMPRSLNSAVSIIPTGSKRVLKHNVTNKTTTIALLKIKEAFMLTQTRLTKLLMIFITNKGPFSWSTEELTRLKPSNRQWFHMQEPVLLPNKVHFLSSANQRISSA